MAFEAMKCKEGYMRIQRQWPSLDEPHEGWTYVFAVGLMLGLGFAWLQQRTGIIKMPGNFLIESYPVVIQSLDIWVTALSVALVGWLIALIPARRIGRE